MRKNVNSRVTIRDVAARAGVSPSTAHLVVAGKAGPKEETRQQVLRVIEELHYQCNTAASALKRGETWIGAVLPASEGGSELYYGPIWEGVRAYCESAQDFNIQLIEMPYLNSESVTVQMESVEKILATEKLSGVVMLGDIAPDVRKALRKLSDGGLPIVLVNGGVPEISPVCSVQTENYLLGCTMAEILVRLTPDGGKILVCAGSENTPANAEMVQGLETYLSRQVQKREIHKIYYGYSHDEIKRLYTQLLKVFQKEKIRACCSVTARGSIQLARALEETGLAGRISAIGSDIFPQNIDSLRRDVFQNLIFKNPYQQGWKAAERLFQYIFRIRRTKGEVLRIKGEVVFQSSIPMYK